MRAGAHGGSSVVIVATVGAPFSATPPQNPGGFVHKTFCGRIRQRFVVNQRGGSATSSGGMAPRKIAFCNLEAGPWADGFYGLPDVKGRDKSRPYGGVLNNVASQ